MVGTRESANQESPLFSIVFESLAEGLILVGTDGTIRFCNPASCNMFGYAKEELVGLPVDELVPEMKRKGHQKHREGFAKSPQARAMGAGINLLAKRKDDSVFPVEISLNHFRDGADMVIVALITDISDRKKAEDTLKEYTKTLEDKVEARTAELRNTIDNLEGTNLRLETQIKETKEAEKALEESQNLYRVIARNFPKGTISVFDRDLNYVFAEGQELFRLGVTSESLIGTSFAKRLNPSIRKETTEKLQEVFKGESKRIEIKLKGNHYLINAVPLIDPGGEVKRIMVVEQNVTEQKVAEENIRQSLEKEKQLGELKSRFVTMASHEFRTPLSTILSSIYLVEQYIKKGEHEKGEKHIGRIRSSVNNLNNILNDFLNLGKLEEGLVEAKPEHFNLKEFCSELSEEMQGIAKKGQKINYECLSNSPEVYLDKAILRNILHNLLSNAIKYSDEGGSIQFLTHRKDQLLRIEISDQGIGIPKGDQEHLFERFFRANNVNHIQGTGLGLNIVRRYVDLLEGTINFTSEENIGTTFTIDLNLSEEIN